MELDNRIELLERHSQRLAASVVRLRALVTALAALLALIVVGGFSNATSVVPLLRTERLQLMSSGDRPMALADIQAADDGSARVVIKNAAGHLLVVLGSSPDGSGFVGTYDGKGWPMAELATNGKGQGRVQTFDSQGTPLTRLDGTPDRFGVIQTFHGVDRLAHPTTRLGALPQLDSGAAGILLISDGFGAQLDRWPPPSMP